MADSNRRRAASQAERSERLDFSSSSARERARQAVVVIVDDLICSAQLNSGPALRALRRRPIPRAQQARTTDENPRRDQVQGRRRGGDRVDLAAKSEKNDEAFVR